MKWIFRLLNLILLLLIIYLGYTFYQDFSDEKNKGFSVNQSAKTATLKTFLKIRPTIEKIEDGIMWFPNFFSRSSDKISVSSQEVFIETRGIPDMYIILFSGEEIDKTGRHVLREEIRRVDTWFYDGPYDSIVSFDNGFFVEEKDVKEPVDLKEYNISPLFFTSATNPGDVTALLGFPDCAEEFEAGDNCFVTIKYNIAPERPLVSVTFLNDEIISATVGIAFMREGEIGNTLCPF